MYPLDNTGSCTVSNGPVKIIKWKDKQTKAIGWIVIHSLINGIAGGGLFMHAKATLQEVSDLAKSMSYKNCIIKNPQMGGAKGGIKFDANHPEAQNVLARFLIDNKAIIENLWCTGGDLNTSNEIIETIVKRELGFPSAFVCLARSLSKVEQIPDQSANISARITTPLNELFNIGQCATGYSVCQTIKLVTNNTPRVLIQGFGKVGSSLAYFLQSLQLGIIVGICEKDGYIYNENGIDAIALIKARLSSHYNPLFPLKSLLNPEQCSQYHWTPAASSSDKTLNELLNNINADVLSPCAERYSINEDSINRFINHKNQKYIVSGANNPFTSFAVIEHCLKNNIVLIPDWVSNSGNAILFVEALRCNHWYSNSTDNILNIIRHYLEQFLSEAKALKRYNQASLFEGCYLIAQQKNRFASF